MRGRCEANRQSFQRLVGLRLETSLVGLSDKGEKVSGNKIKALRDCNVDSLQSCKLCCNVAKSSC